jgi:hypothetical protein
VAVGTNLANHFNTEEKIADEPRVAEELGGGPLKYDWAKSSYEIKNHSKMSLITVTCEVTGASKTGTVTVVTFKKRWSDKMQCAYLAVDTQDGTRVLFDDKDIIPQLPFDERISWTFNNK